MEGTSFWNGMKKKKKQPLSGEHKVGHKEATSIKSGNKTGRDTVSAAESSGYYKWASKVRLERFSR